MLFINREYASKEIYPEFQDIFSFMRKTSYDRIKVVILGQDPYYNKGQANGLAFSVKPGVPIPRSLQNIFKELESDLGIPPPIGGDLSRWAKQGVLLLNTVLTVQDNHPNSHKNRGWEIFTRRIIEELCLRRDPVVFVLWGKDAQRFAEFVYGTRHFVIESSHPSPLSAHISFFGSKPFSRTNRFLEYVGHRVIDWRL